MRDLATYISRETGSGGAGSRLVLLFNRFLMQKQEAGTWLQRDVFLKGLC